MIGAATVLMLSSPFSLFSQPIAQRDDLSPALKELICKGMKGEDARQKLWQHQIYDTFINVRHIRSNAAKVLPLKDVRNYALKLAKSSGHRSISFGHCQDQSSWLATLPSPSPLISHTGQMTHLQLSRISHACQRYSVHFADKRGGKAQKLWTSKGSSWQSPGADISLNTYFLPEGHLSISCLPKIKNEGWQLLVLAPIHGSDAFSDPPFLRALESEGLISWINRVRQYHNLTDLDPHGKELLQSSRRLLKTGTARHNRQDLRQEKKRLLESKLVFIGENRVKGVNLKDLAWLLWNSPRHRNLLLSQDATHLGLSLQKSATDLLAVIVMARR